MKKAITLLLVTLAGPTLAGCQTAMQVQDANEQLTNYYNAKVQAEGDPVMEETARASLDALAKTAAEQAGAETDPLNKIGFYRIAATAAWQAGDRQVVEYTTLGSAICETEWARAPRDCGMLTFVDDLAAIDETTARFNALKTDLENTHAPTDEQAQEGVDIFERYEESAVTMIENRPVLQNRAPENLLAAYDEKLDDLICKHVGFSVGLALTAGATIDGDCRVENLRFKAMEVGAQLPSCTGSAPTEIAECDS